MEPSRGGCPIATALCRGGSDAGQIQKGPAKCGPLPSELEPRAEARGASLAGTVMRPGQRDSPECGSGAGAHLRRLLGLLHDGRRRGGRRAVRRRHAARWRTPRRAWHTQWKVSCLRTSSGMSSMSASLSFGRMIVRDAGAVGAEHLLLHAADRQHAAAQRDLAGHRHVAAAPGGPTSRRRAPSPSRRRPTGRPSGSRPRERGRAPRSSRAGPRGSAASTACVAA